MGLYLIIGALIFMLYGWVLNSSTLKAVYNVSVSQNGHPVDVAFDLYRKHTVQRRFVMAALFAVSAYFFTEFALRPVRKTAELQKRFIAIVSHELRTPLAIMKNSSEVALRNPAALDHEKALRIIKSNLEETDRLSQTVQFLLNFSLLRTQKRIPEVRQIVLTELVEKLIPLLETEAVERSVQLECAFEDAGNVLGNQIALEGLIINLVKNAIAHSPKGGVVTIKTEKIKSRVRFSVSDTGKGIAKKDLPYIFEAFYRGKDEDELEETHNGFGLGLSWVKEIANFHSAYIDVDTNEKKGTTFTITFRT